MLLRIGHGVLRICWQTVVAATVLLALTLIAGRLLVLAMSDPEDIEAMLKDRGFEYVSLQSIDGGWQMHDPSITVEKLALKPGGVTAMELDHVVLQVDTFRSLFAASPIFSEIIVDGVRFTLEFHEGGYRIRGFDRGNGDANLDLLFDSLPHMDRIQLSGVDIAVEGLRFSGHLVSTEEAPLVLTAEGQKKNLSFPLKFEPSMNGDNTAPSQLIIAGHYRGDPREPSFEASLYMKTTDLDLVPALETIDIGGRHVSSANLDSQTWIVMDRESVDVTGSLRIAGVALDSEVLAERIETGFRFSGTSWGEGSLTVPRAVLTNGDFSFELEDIRAAVGTKDGAGHYGGVVKVVDVQRVTSLLDYLAGYELLPERFSRALAALSPRGELVDLHFFGGVDGSSIRLVSNLQAFSMDAYLGVPSITDLNGFLLVEPERGHLDIHNEAFEMYFSNMFKAPWLFDAGSGRVAYNLQDGTLRVNSGLIELVQGDLTAHGKLSLNLPGERSEQTWGLTIGIRDADLKTADIYVPNTIPDDVRTWLESAIRGGRGVETGLTFHGLLYRDAPGVGKSHDLFFGVEDAVLSYHEDWPLIEDLAGVVHVNNYFVASDKAVARVYDSRIVDANVMVPINHLNKADTVLVQGQAAGPLSDGVKILNETSLAKTTSNMAREWLAGGDMQAQLSLNVPVGDRREEEVASEVTVAVRGNRLEMPEFDLVIDELSGDILYSNDRGLTADAFSGRTFGEPITGSIETDVSGDSGEVEVHVRGAIAVDDLYEWSDQLLLSRAEGRLNYETTVHVPYGGSRDAVFVEAASDLTGVVMNLPAPLDKTDPATALDFDYRQIFADEAYQVDMKLADRARASLKIRDGIAVGGRIHFGEEAFGAVAYDAIRMSGTVPYINYEAWEQVTEELGQLSDVSLEDKIAEHVAVLELNIDELLVFELSLEDVDTRVTRDGDKWIANLQNDMLAGNVIVPDADDADIGIHLDRLSFESEGEDTDDPFADVDPLGIVNIDFSTGQLLLDGEDYGAWSFHYNVDGNVARFDRLLATAAGVSVKEGSMAEWRRTGGQHTSRFKGSLEIDDLATALTKFGYASSIEGTGIKVNADISWPGSPAMIDADALVGAVNIEEGEGRFVQADTGGALKLLGIFDFASIARRFRLDFSDVIQEGFEFDDISGGTAFDAGTISVTEPLIIDGSGGKFTVGGTVDLHSGALDNDMIVTLPVNRTLPWYAAYSAIATGPLAGAGVWLAQKLFENQIDTMSSAKYKISGTIQAPVIEFITIFDDDVREASPVAQSD